MKYIIIALLILSASCRLDTYQCECYTDKLVDTKEIKTNKHHVADYECTAYHKQIQDKYPTSYCYIAQ